MNILNEIQNIKTQSELNAFKTKVNEAIEKRAEFLNLCDFANKASQKSFGFIKESFESISPVLFNKKGGKKIMSNYMLTIKENKNLLKLHNLYENLRKMSSSSDINFFVNNLTETNWNLKKEDFNSEIKKLGRILAEGILKVGNESFNLISESTNTKLDSAIEFIIENKKTVKNIAKYSEAVSIIKEHISNNPQNTLFETVNIDDYANKLLESFNKKYTNDLTENDWAILKEISQSSNKEELFNKYKEECVNKLTEVENKYKKEGANEEQQKVNAVLEKINKKSFVLENITADICGFAEIRKIFE